MSLRNWWRLLRVYSFPATVIPVICATLASRRLTGGQVAIWTVSLMLLSALFLHAAVNLLNDYYDFTLGYDTEQSQGSSGLLVSGEVDPSVVLLWGRIYLLLAVTTALPLVVLHGWTLFIMSVFGFAGVLFYSHDSMGYKYRGLGEVAVFLLMGPLLYSAASLVVSGKLNKQTLLLSLPYGFLVTAIMLANNLRDVEKDRRDGFRTLPQVVGPLISRLLLSLLLLAPVPLLLLTVLLGLMPGLTALVIVTLVAVVPLLRDIWSREPSGTALSTAPQRTAAVYLLFGILVILGELGTTLL